MNRRSLMTGAIAFAGLSACGRAGAPAGGGLLNASYDPTRELYQELNAAFVAANEAAYPGARIDMSHGGSGRQARAIIDGLKADVATLALAPDIDALVARDLVRPDWRDAFPYRATPFYSTIVLLVREGNPRRIRGWEDLARSDVAVITPNPKTSGGARWNYLAMWAQAARAGGEKAALDYLQGVFARVPVLDTGARGSTTTFAQRGIGDVLVTWESEAMLAKREFGDGRLEIVYPATSIRAEPPVAIVDAVVEAKGTRPLAEAYLGFHYAPEGQALAAKHFLRPTDADARAAASFPAIEMIGVDEAFGSWAAAQKTHFDEGGVFDRLTTRR